LSGDAPAQRTHEWVDAAVSGAIGLVAVPPVLLGTAYGIWKENRLEKEVWQAALLIFQLLGRRNPRSSAA
jgi:integral membrane sensor domain MASE1